MPLFKKMGFMPDMGKLTGDLTAKFDQLILEIRGLHDVLVEIRNAIQTKP